MRKSLIFAVSLGGLVTMVGNETECAAFNETTHRRIVETAANVISAVENSNGAIPAPPAVDGSVIPPAVWSKFVTRLSATNRRLATMRTGMTGAYMGGGDRDVMDPEAVPGGSAPPNSIAASTQNNPVKCGYNKTDASGRELNLLNAGDITIGDFPYYAEDAYRPCAYSSLPALPGTPTTADLRAQRVGAVLGWHAMSIDRRTSDSAVWDRPTNSAQAGGLFIEALSRGFEYYLGALLVPIVCFKSFFETASFEHCNAFDLSRKVNPVEYMRIRCLNRRMARRVRVDQTSTRGTELASTATAIPRTAAEQSRVQSAA